MNRPLQVMKFGGTSVGSAERIHKAAEIVAKAAREKELVVVVSAMAGVTNALVHAAHRSAGGDAGAAAELGRTLDAKHRETLAALVTDAARRDPLQAQLDAIIEDAVNRCRGVAWLRELTPRTLDAISGAGERLSARIVAATLESLGVRSEAVDATEVIVTDDTHGGAQPLETETRGRAQSALFPRLRAGLVPVVTGFIAATKDGAPTTLGRGGSDLSGTVVGAALDAADVIIWTDVDGVLTADPRLVPDATLLLDISYNEAAELAFFGAKVLHPSTLHPVRKRNDDRSRWQSHRRRREGRHRDARRHAFDGRRAWHHRCPGSRGMDIRGDGGSARANSADFPGVVAGRYLLRRAFG